MSDKDIAKRLKDAEELLDCRAGDLLRRRKPFIVISCTEPYYASAYCTIRAREKLHGTWSADDERAFQDMVGDADWPTFDDFVAGHPTHELGRLLDAVPTWAGIAYSKAKEQWQAKWWLDDRYSPPGFHDATGATAAEAVDNALSDIAVARAAGVVALPQGEDTDG